jgi:predicted transcriptional regulator
MFDALLAKIKTEPAVLIAFLAAVVQALEAQDAVTWQTVLTVVAGVVIRQLVTPASVVEGKVEQAHVDGYVLGAGLPPEQPEPGDFG